jgi:hypothetical protein
MQVPTQRLFSKAAKDFPETSYNFENNLRGILFRARYLTWKYAFESSLRKDINHSGFTKDFNFFTPGLETAYALKYASQNNA